MPTPRDSIQQYEDALDDVLENVNADDRDLDDEPDCVGVDSGSGDRNDSDVAA